MSTCEKLEGYGFICLASLWWANIGKDFRLEGSTTSWKTTSSFIYAWVDKGTDRILNVGHTGQTFSGRFGDYVRWLNGKRKNDCDTPIRRAWLACFSGCDSGQIEVWVKPSATDRPTREADERSWISRLRPVLNRR